MLKNLKEFKYAVQTQSFGDAIEYLRSQNKTFLENGHSEMGKYGWKQTILSFATQEGALEIVDYLLTRNVWIDKRDSSNPVRLAAGAGNITILRKLIAYGADLNLPNTNINWEFSTSNEPLHLAVNAGSVACTTLLLEHGVDANSGDEQPLAIACSSPKTTAEMVKLLLAYGANPHAKYSYGCDALYWTVMENRPEHLKVLLEHKVDVNALYSNPINEKKISALQIAHGKGHKECTDLLIANGADASFLTEV